MILAAVACTALSAFHALDFWIGTWRVTSGSQYAGTDVVASELSSCMITERWTDADGSHGFSFFVYDVNNGQWKQTWVTDQATRVGGLKYKTLVYIYPDGGTRFEGMLPAPPGSKPILDRTTLRPLSKDRVHQVIEISRDGGEHWLTSFDAIYTRSKPH